jgi:hypothetical protein
VETPKRSATNRVQAHEILEIEPPTNLNSFFGGKPPKLWCSGEPAILTGKLLGILSARQIDHDLALKSSQLLKQVASLKSISFIGGWHSPLEEEALRILLASQAPIVFCVPKSLNQFTPSVEVNNRVHQGQGLLLTHCSAKANQPGRVLKAQSIGRRPSRSAVSFVCTGRECLVETGEISDASRKAGPNSRAPH